MSSTNKTTYYELPQFVDNDIFNPLVDDNDAFDKIDTALHNIAGAEADDASEIVGIKSRLDSAESDIDALEAQNGNSVLTTTAQTLSGAVNELDADVSALDGRVDIVEDDINNASTGLKPKVGALETLTDSIYHGGVENGSIAYNKLSPEAIKMLEDNSKIIFMPVAYYESTYASGECTVIVTDKNKKVIMCDSGNTYSYDEIKAELVANGITHIDYFILSHYHADHYANIGSLIADGYINDDTIAVLPRTTTAPGATWIAGEAQVREWFADNEVITPDSTVPLVVDEFKFEFMNCDVTDIAYYESESITDGNNYSIAYYVTKDNFTLFMTGDIQKVAVNYLNSRNLFRQCDILHVPHHAWGGDASDQPESIYLITRPTYAVASLNRWNDMTVGEGVDSSEKIYLMNALGIPCYMCGYGAMYVGVGDNIYSFFPNGKQIVAETALESMKFNLYVDDTYIGISYGDVDHPFVSLTKALTFAKTLRASYVYIHIIGEYSHIEESISISWNGELQIGGTKNGDVNNVTIGIFRLYSGFARLTNINISGASNIAVASFHAYLMLESCVVDGDMTGATSLGNGRGIVANQNGYIFLDGTTVSNKRVALGCYDGGSITCDGLKGTNNEVLISGIQGGDVIVRDNSTVAYTTFVDLIALGDPRIPLRSAQFGKSKAYSSNSSYHMYHIDNTGTEGSVTLDFSSNIVKRKIIRLFNAQGAVYQFNVNAQSMTEPTVVQTAINSSIEPNWAITYDRTAKTVTVTFENWVTAIVE